MVFAYPIGLPPKYISHRARIPLYASLRGNALLGVITFPFISPNLAPTGKKFTFPQKGLDKVIRWIAITIIVIGVVLIWRGK